MVKVWYIFMMGCSAVQKNEVRRYILTLKDKLLGKKLFTDKCVLYKSFFFFGKNKSKTQNTISLNVSSESLHMKLKTSFLSE